MKKRECESDSEYIRNSSCKPTVGKRDRQSSEFQLLFESYSLNWNLVVEPVQHRVYLHKTGSHHRSPSSHLSYFCPKYRNTQSLNPNRLLLWYSLSFPLSPTSLIVPSTYLYSRTDGFLRSSLPYMKTLRNSLSEGSQFWYGCDVKKIIFYNFRELFHLHNVDRNVKKGRSKNGFQRI